jgi:alpha-tubulin suppressor-like RCC1 family protein
MAAWGWNGFANIDAIGPVAEVAFGLNHVIARREDGLVMAWGRDDAGQCNVPATLGTCIAVAAGTFHSLAIRSDRRVVCFGDNTNQKCTVPPNLAGVVSVAGGDSHSAAVTDAGSVVCWGSNADGQCTPPPTIGPARQVACGWYHTVALLQDGTVACWGRNTSGQCTPPIDLTGVVKVTAGQSHSIALLATGQIRCWGGEYGWGSCGAWTVDCTQASAGRYGTAVITRAGDVVSLGNGTWPIGISNARSVATNGSYGSFVIATRIDGTLASSGQGGYGNTSPVPMPAMIGAVTQVAAGAYHTVALRSDGTVACFGGSNNTTSATTPPVGLGSVIQVAASRGSSAVSGALRSDGTVVVWGSNFNGQLNVPAGLSGVVQLAIGASYVSAVLQDGGVVSWGSNVPQPPQGIGPVAQIDTCSHTVARLTSGAVVCWGSNAFGRCSPPADLGAVLDVAAGMEHSAAVRIDGTVSCWGNTGDGRCAVPSGLMGVTRVAAGDHHTVALRADGTAVAWGGGSFAWFGSGLVPANLGAVKQISAAGDRTVVALVRACSADLNRDGLVSGPDLGILLGGFGQSGGNSPADLNLDGTVNGADLGILLGSWGACPN